MKGTAEDINNKLHCANVRCPTEPSALVLGFGQLTVHSDIVTDSHYTENISIFHAYARAKKKWILVRLGSPPWQI